MDVCMVARVVAAALVAVGTVTVAPSATGVSPAGSSGGECEVVQLKASPGSPWGTVVDIELVEVDGASQPVYYGSLEIPDEVGVPHQRAALWLGLEAEPMVLDTGYDVDIALELTSTGLANGQSEDWANGREVAWVYDLQTGQLTFVDTGKGWAEGDHPWVRRINSGGALAGVIGRGVGKGWRPQAAGWEHFTGSLRRLQESGEASEAVAINDIGDRAGMRARTRILNGDWLVFDPVMWDAHGGVRPVAKIGLDGYIRGLTEDRQMAGFSFMGPDPSIGFRQATYWASPDEVVGLGVLDGGGWSDAFGIDDSGWVVGGMDRFVDQDDPLGEGWGVMNHNFLWMPQTMQPGQVRVLPSLYAVAAEVDDWHQWAAIHVAHGVNAGLDQVGAGTHVGFADDGRLLGAPTVYLNASSCGEVVDTTQDPWHLTDRSAAQEAAGVIGNPNRLLRPKR